MIVRSEKILQFERVFINTQTTSFCSIKCSYNFVQKFARAWNVRKIRNVRQNFSITSTGSFNKLKFCSWSSITNCFCVKMNRMHDLHNRRISDTTYAMSNRTIRTFENVSDNNRILLRMLTFCFRNWVTPFLLAVTIHEISFFLLNTRALEQNTVQQFSCSVKHKTLKLKHCIKCRLFCGFYKQNSRTYKFVMRILFW